MDHNAQPATTSQPDAESTPNQHAKEEPQCQQTSTDSSQNDTSQVRNSVLEAIADQQRRRISELERTLEKKKATIQRLSATPPLPHPTIPILPPSTISPMHAIPTSAPIPSPPSNSPPVNPTPTSQGASTNSQPPSRAEQTSSQPQPTASTGGSNPVMAAPMLGFPPQPHLPPYPYMFPPPDPAFAAHYMGVMPPTLLHAAHASHAQPSSQAHQQEKGNDGQEQKQSRYWTQDEHERFLAGMKACGPKNYLEISEYVGTRNAKQVRTHAQKYQKRLEREDAKRRSDVRHRRINDSGPMTSVAADAAAAVKAAAAAAMCGKVPGMSSAPVKDSDSTGTPAGPSSSSSGKQCHSSHQHSHGASSGDGSISANTAAERNAETSGATNHSAAVAAIAAEAKALGRGVLPPGAIKIPSQMFGKAPQPTMVNKHTGSVEDNKEVKAGGRTEAEEPGETRGSLGNSVPTVQKCNDAAGSKNNNNGGREAAETCYTKTDRPPTASDSPKGGAQNEHTEANRHSDKDQTGSKHMADPSAPMHTEKLTISQIERETSIRSERKYCQNEPFSQRTEAGNDPEVKKATAGSVVHTRLTKTAAGLVTKEKVASGTDSGATTVKCEPERVDTYTNLLEGRKGNPDSDPVAGKTSGDDGKANVSSFSLAGMQGEAAQSRPAAAKREAHMVGVEERESNKSNENGAVVSEESRTKDSAGSEKAEEKSGIGEKRSVGSGPHGRGHGAGDRSDCREGKKGLAATKQASTALNADGTNEESAVECRKRACDGEATKGNKRARKDDGDERKESTAAERVGGASLRTRPTGGNSAVAASQQT